MARKPRKQRVTLRFKRREQLKHHVRSAVGRSVALALIAGFGIGICVGGDSFLSKFLRTHTPNVTIQAPQLLAGLPTLTELPKERVLMWLPGSGYFLQKKICRKYPSVNSLSLERQPESNRITIHLKPRVPLVICGGSGFDRDGILFAITPGTWGALPQASFSAGAHKADLGRWLSRLVLVTEIWSQVASLKQDVYGMIEFTLKTGTVVVWGPPEIEPLNRKAQTLARILDDAHKNLSGTARADLRFFDQGRIIVRPKTLSGRG